MNISDLKSRYDHADQHYQKFFAEQRNNLLISFGDHWNSRAFQQIRSAQNVNEQSRIRITKNHIGLIVRKIQNEILRHAPSVGISAKNENELSDQKSAEIANAVWQDLKNQNKLDQQNRELVKDFVELGEVCLRVKWNPHGGEFLGYDVDFYEGQQISDPTPVFDGKIELERILGINLLIDPYASVFDQAEWVCIRKMTSVKSLRRMIPHDDQRQKFLEPGRGTSYKVFEPANRSYSNSDELLLMEFYFRQCQQYPNGYYAIATELGILFEGELPYGIWPIAFAPYNTLSTTPRGYSLIRDLRPCQVEINRCASKIAEHQVSLGDDKVLLQSGTEFRRGKTVHGVRSIEIRGARPEIIPGRSGNQYFEYLQSQVSELYQIANINEHDLELSNQANPYLALFQSIRDRKKFSLHASKFEEFLIDGCNIALQFAKKYYDSSRIVPAVGKSEQINISEFTKEERLSYQVKLLPQSDDVETKIGRQLSLNHLMQYGSAHLDRSDIGQILRAMPYANTEQLFGDLTAEYDGVVADILAMERGVERHANQSDNHTYHIKKLSQRMKALDFEQLHPFIRNLFQAKLEEHQIALAQQKQEEQLLKSNLVPSGGGLVGCDFYEQNEKGTARRIKVPYASLKWLVDKLKQQGMEQDELEELEYQQQIEILNKTATMQNHEVPNGNETHGYQ